MDMERQSVIIRIYMYVIEAKRTSPIRELYGLFQDPSRFWDLSMARESFPNVHSSQRHAFREALTSRIRGSYLLRNS